MCCVLCGLCRLCCGSVGRWLCHVPCGFCALLCDVGYVLQAACCVLCIVCCGLDAVGCALLDILPCGLLVMPLCGGLCAVRCTPRKKTKVRLSSVHISILNNYVGVFEIRSCFRVYFVEGELSNRILEKNHDFQFCDGLAGGEHFDKSRFFFSRGPCGRRRFRTIMIFIC